MPTPAARTLAEFVHGIRWDSLDDRVKAQAKWCLLDWAACTLGGSLGDPARAVARTVRLYGHPADEGATAVGFAGRVHVLDACVINGTAAHSEDFDDTILDCAVHAGAVVVTAAAALGEALHASGRALIEAIVSGYEVAARVGMAVNEMPWKAHHGRGFHPTGTCGVFGAAAAAAKLLGLNVDETCMALGIAGSYASGLMEFLSNGSQVKRLHPGAAAKNGIFSAMLAKNGLTGPETVFEGRDGFLRAYTDRSDPRWLTWGLGDQWYILRTSFKFYACCHHCHTPIDALLELVQSNSLAVDHIAHVDVRHPTAAHYLVGEPLERKRRPETVVDAQMSLPYCLAVALTDGHVGVRQFDEAHRTSAPIRKLMDAVTPAADQGLDREFTATQWPAVVTVTLKDGRTLEARSDHPKGSPENPMSEADFITKFSEQAARVLERADMDQLASRLLEIDGAADVGVVLRELAAGRELA